MEEIDLKLLVKYFFSKIIVIISVVLLFAISGIIYIKTIDSTTKTTYKGVATIVIKNNSKQLVIVDSEIENIKNDLSKIYIEIIKSDEVLDGVIKNLSLDDSVNDLKKNIAVESLNNSDAIKIIVSNSNQEKAKLLASEISSVFSEEIIKIYDIENIETFTRTEITTSSNKPNEIQTIFKFTLVGLILVVVFLFIRYYFDFTIKSANDIEDLDLKIVGVITNARRKKNEK